MEVTKLMQKFEDVQKNRSTWEETWQEVIHYCNPSREGIYDGDLPGDIKNADVPDDTAAISSDRLAAMINSTITNQATDWFDISINDEELKEKASVKQWLNDLNKQVKRAFDESNFYSSVNEMYLDLTTVGTGVMFIGSSDELDKDLTFSTRHIKEIYIAESHEGKVDTLFRKFKWTARQIVQKWGIENVSDHVKEEYNEGNEEKDFDILHCVFPREDWVFDEDNLDAKKMKFASHWLELDEETELAESGYEEFPYVVPRWIKNTTEKYGRSPSITLLPSIKSVNRMKETLLRTGEKVADPPINIPDENEDVDMNPGGKNYYDPQTEGWIRPIDLGANLPVNLEMLNTEQDHIRDGYLMNQLQVINKTEMTALEVRTRMTENMRVLGPTFGRLMTEFMDVLLNRVISILQRSTDRFGLPRIPEAPKEIEGKEFLLIYTSPLARAQKQSYLQSTMIIVNTAIEWSRSTERPEILDNVDFDEAIKFVADASGDPVGVMRTKDQVQEIRVRRAELQKAQQEMQMQQMQIEQQQAQMGMVEQGANATEKVAKAESYAG